MITIFNGRRRRLGQDAEAETEIYLQVSVKLRKHLALFKGAPLAVFMAVALHTNDDGWAFPSIALLSAETGYNRQTVSDALTHLDEVRIDGHRVLLIVQPREDNRFANNHYLIFPTVADVAHWHAKGLTRKPRAPNVENVHTKDSVPDPADPVPSVVFSYTKEPSTPAPYTKIMNRRRSTSKKNHVKEKPAPSGEDAGALPSELYLIECGAYPATAREFSAFPLEALQQYVEKRLKNTDRAQWPEKMGMIVSGLRRVKIEGVLREYERAQQTVNWMEEYRGTPGYYFGDDMTGLEHISTE